MPPSDRDPPESRERLPESREQTRPSVTRDVLRAYLRRPEVQASLRNVVAAALGDRAERTLVDDLANETQLVALEAEQLAESEATLGPWLHGVARNVVHEYFAEDRKVRRHVVLVGDVQMLEDRGEQAEQRAEEDDLPARPEAADVPVATDADAEGWHVSPWLRERVRHEPKELELWEILREKARTKKTYEQIARERGTTPAALYLRIHRLKTKYEGPWREYKRKRDGGIVLLLLLAAVVLVVLAVVVRPWPRGRRVEPIGPDVVPSASAGPSASVAPPPAPLPVGLPPRRDKPAAPADPGKPR